FIQLHRVPPDLLSFPTRRSSDLHRAMCALFADAPSTFRMNRHPFAALPRTHASRSRSAPRFTCVLRTALSCIALLFTIACADDRSEEHTSELQSRENLVCRLLLE